MICIHMLILSITYKSKRFFDSRKEELKEEKRAVFSVLIQIADELSL